MNLRLQHAVIRVTSIIEAKNFYLQKLGMEVLEEANNFFAAKAGNVRLSFFEGYEKAETGEDAKTGISLIFRVDSLDDAIAAAQKNGIKLIGDVINIPNFHKFQEFEDPDGNIFFFAEYYVEPV